jgi:hypothetical protein
LTAEKTPTGGFPPDHSKEKCRALPRKTMKTMPASSRERMALVQTHAPNLPGPASISGFLAAGLRQGYSAAPRGLRG